MMMNTHMSSLAISALEDFSRILRILKKESMTESDFIMILYGAGIQDASIAKEAFAKLTMQCGLALEKEIDSIDVTALKALYESSPYQDCESSELVANRILNEFFDSFDADHSDSLDKDEALKALNLFVNDASAADVDAFFSAIDADGNGMIDREEFNAGLLRRERWMEHSKMSAFNPLLLEPAHADEATFVAGLENCIVSHVLFKHHMLDNLATGTFGASTSVKILYYLKAYSHFSRGFVDYMTKLKAMVKTAEHVEILEENIAEELGSYSDADVEMMKLIGLDPNRLIGVKHGDLFRQCIQSLQSSIQEPFPSLNYEEIASGLKSVFDKSCISPAATVESALGALYFGSELLVPKMYGFILQAFALHTSLSLNEYSFFELHVNMDKNHAAAMRQVVLASATSKESRLKMVLAATAVMDARVEFLDQLVAAMHAAAPVHISTPIRSGSIGGNQHLLPPLSITRKCKQSQWQSQAQCQQTVSSLYDNQSAAWDRDQPNCLSDFTGRPIVFNMCQPHIVDACVLDIGCGEGYCARKFVQMGAASVVGIDISEEMIKRANARASPNEHYFHGNAVSSNDIIKHNINYLPKSVKVELKNGCFDLVAGVFLFNYLNISQMKTVMCDTFRLLKPGGHFIFSVPNPMLPFLETANDSSFSFNTGAEEGGSMRSYYSSRDLLLSGTIKTLSGKSLNVRMMFKTLTDYIQSIQEAGLELVQIHEAKVEVEVMPKHPAFFASVCDKPLHLIFKVRKPAQVAVVKDLAKKLLWLPYQIHDSSYLMMTMPPEVEDQLVRVVNQIYDAGVRFETFEWATSGVQVSELNLVHDLGTAIRTKLMEETGACILRRLDLTRFSSDPNPLDPNGVDNAGYQDMVGRAKLAYFILLNFVGVVDGAARGRLFDVKNTDADFSSDNVLFSVSNSEADWHTDGASREKVYDVVSLLSIKKSAVGGQFKVSNAVNALENLKMKLPQFLLYELLRPLPRDILENGKGRGVEGDMLTKVTRSDTILKLRLKRNAFPIFVDQGDRMKFRYMRYWIETAHRKIGWSISPLLVVAMDLLDRELNTACCFEEALDPGDMVFSNNLLIAHARKAFEDVPPDMPRHKVRAWLQIRAVHKIA